jgi:hypothetical protein
VATGYRSKQLHGHTGKNAPKTMQWKLLGDFAVRNFRLIDEEPEKKESHTKSTESAELMFSADSVDSV